MIKTTKGFASVGLIIGNDKQLNITIPHSDWKQFDVGNRVKLISEKGEFETYGWVRAIGNGKQRRISISNNDRTMFKKGDKVLIYPLMSQSLNDDK